MQEGVDQVTRLRIEKVMDRERKNTEREGRRDEMEQVSVLVLSQCRRWALGITQAPQKQSTKHLKVRRKNRM